MVLTTDSILIITCKVGEDLPESDHYISRLEIDTRFTVSGKKLLIPHYKKKKNIFKMRHEMRKSN